MRCHQQFSKQEYLSSYFRIILSFFLFSLLSHDSRTCDLRVFWMNRKCYSFSPEQHSTPNCANRSPPTIQYRRLYRVYRRVFEDSCVYAAYISFITRALLYRIEEISKKIVARMERIHFTAAPPTHFAYSGLPLSKKIQS